MPKREAPSIAGPGIVLRPLTSDHLELTLGWRNREENRRWFLNSEPIGWEQHLRWFEGYSQRDDDFLFVIEDLESGGQPVGQVSLYRIDWARRTAEFGRLLVGEPSARGKGLGLSATRTLTDFGFRSWELSRIHLEVLRQNDRAIRIYRDCGFIEIDSHDDSVIMERTQPEPAGECLVAGVSPLPGPGVELAEI